jgi:hypothetical protein
MIDWWSGTAGVLIGAILASAIPTAVEWWRRRVERRGELIAMSAEYYLAARALHALETENVQAPLYRIPLTMFEHALPKLIGEGSLKTGEIAVLIEYVNRIEELNRGLGRASAAHAAEQPKLTEDEFRRNLAKVAGLRAADARFKGDSLFDLTADILFEFQVFEDSAWTRSDLESAI